MDFAEQNPRAGTLARPYDYFIDSLRPQLLLRPFSVSKNPYVGVGLLDDPFVNVVVSPKSA